MVSLPSNRAVTKTALPSPSWCWHWVLWLKCKSLCSQIKHFADSHLFIFLPLNSPISFLHCSQPFVYSQFHLLQWKPIYTQAITFLSSNFRVSSSAEGPSQSHCVCRAGGGSVQDNMGTPCGDASSFIARCSCADKTTTYSLRTIMEHTLISRFQSFFP